MINCRFAVCAERVIRDAESNNLTLVNICEELTAHGFPFFVQRLDFCFMLSREAGDPGALTDVRFKLTVGNQLLHENTIPVNFDGRLRTRSILSLGGLVIPLPGELRAELESDLVSGMKSWVVIINQGAAIVAPPRAG